MIDGDPDHVEWCRYLLQPLNYGLQFRHLFVTREGIGELKAEARHPDPDVFSLDIDGNDYHIGAALLDAGFRPRIWMVEYNSAFGPDAAVTIPYDAAFRVANEPGRDLYCGCSIGAWRSLMTRHGYRFATVDQCGVNAVFLDPPAFPPGFAEGLRGLDFRPNVSHVRAYGPDWQGHAARVEAMPVVAV